MKDKKGHEGECLWLGLRGMQLLADEPRLTNRKLAEELSAFYPALAAVLGYEP